MSDRSTHSSFQFAIRAIILAGILAACFSAALAQSEDDVIKVDSSIVVLNATIRDAQNHPVSALQQKDFKILEDGVQQQIISFETQEAPFAAVILFDTSGSMESRISIARAAAINFLDGLRADDVTAIYKFDSKIDMVQDFSDSRDVSDKIFDLKADGMTALNDAVYKAVSQLSDRSEKRKAIVIISDGADNMSSHSAEKALKGALAANVTIYSLDMSSMETNAAERRQNQGVLRNFAEKTGGTFISTENGLAMREALKAIVNELQIQYTLAYEPADTKRDGKWHTLELRVARPSLIIRTRQGYNAAKNGKAK
ncbi:MAG TPA: VWA domain-containing protein [Pyrinomonadaceae bacterium]